MTVITPTCFEEVAQAYARLINANKRTLSDVPTTITRVYDRVSELVSKDNKE